MYLDRRLSGRLDDRVFIISDVYAIAPYIRTYNFLHELTNNFAIALIPPERVQDCRNAACVEVTNSI